MIAIERPPPEKRPDMDFSFTPEQQAIREMARRFAREKLLPDYAKREAEGRFDRVLLREMGGLGLIAPDLPEGFGGHGLDGITAGLIIEELAYGDFNVAYVPLLSSLAGQVLCAHARPEVARGWTLRLIAGDAVIGLALTEPRGSDAARLALKAERRGNAGYRLNGEKTSISFSDQADVMVVFARTGTAEEKAKGVSAFLVPMDLPGIARTRFDDLGSGAVGRGSVFFEDVDVPADACWARRAAASVRSCRASTTAAP